MVDQDRQELLQNAVAFLQDPQTQASTLAQRVQFLEAKGLTSAEIESALQSAASSQVSAPVGPYSGYPVQATSPYLRHHPRPWDWRDYFITTVVSGALAYGAVSLFRKYVLPQLQPPDATAYESDRDSLTAQFDSAEALLKDILAETAAVRAAVDEQKERVDKTTDQVQAAVTDMRESENRTRDEVREIREEVQTIREMLPKMIEKNKDTHEQSLAEIQQELKSLKALLLSRGPTLSGPSTPIPVLGKPSIPAWQLASSSDATSSQSPSLTNGKGKEVERLDPET